MAIFNIQYRSKVLNKSVGFTVIIPEEAPAGELPTLYLLHGMHQNHSEWARKSSLERYVQKRGIAVVMPDGELSFYHDMAFGEKYFTFIADELVDYTRKVFRLSPRREDTYIAGLSMGGYGAFRFALLRPDRFSAAASLSGCLDMVATSRSEKLAPYAPIIWGFDHQCSVENSDSDLFHLVKNWPVDTPRPRLFAACGSDDYLYESNEKFAKLMAEHPEFEYVFESATGTHSWKFWDKWITPALDFILK